MYYLVIYYLSFIVYYLIYFYFGLLFDYLIIFPISSSQRIIDWKSSGEYHSNSPN